MSAVGWTAENICSRRVFRLLTHVGCSCRRVERPGLLPAAFRKCSNFRAVIDARYEHHYTLEEILGYIYAVLHHPRSPQFTYPLLTALVELDEGVRLLTNLVAVEPADVRIGMPVRVMFVPTDHEMSIPVFTPAEAGR